MLIGVYGTLKGLDTRYSHSTFSAAFVDHAITVDKMHMFDGGFPVVLPVSEEFPLSADSGRVVLEVYDVSEETVIGPLDSYEGYPNLYGREEYNVVTNAGQPLKVWIYTGNNIKSACKGSRRPVVPGHLGTLHWPYREEKAMQASDYNFHNIIAALPETAVAAS